MGAAERVLTFEEAFHRVEQEARQCSASSKEPVALADSAGRVLAESIDADRDFPPFPRSTRDGYAMKAADVVSTPVKLRVIAEIKAGEDASRVHVNAGEAASIMTGAPVPPGADSVVMVEYTKRAGDSVEVTSSTSAGENIVPTGAEAARGSVLATAGTRIDAAIVALAASVGKSSLQVFRKPAVAILATGDEIVSIDSQPGPSQIRNSNSHSLAAQVRSAGGEPLILPVARDEESRLQKLIGQGLRSDLLILSGGVSMGKYDLVERVLEEFDAQFFFTGAKIQPGKPIVFGKVQEKYFFGLPGNPVSTMVTFGLFVKPMIDALSGTTAVAPRFLRARLRKPIHTKPGLKRFLPGLLTGEFENAEAELLSWQGSGDLASVARSNCFIVIPADRNEIPAGEWISVLTHDN